MWRHYVYLHRKASDGTPFYVGKGGHRQREKTQSFERAFTSDSRNSAWRKTVAKHGFVVEIVASCKDDLAAQTLERQLIAEIGRRDMRRGTLINLTDGGDGHSGLIVPDALRQKRSANAKHSRSEAWITSIRAARKNGGNGGVVKRGDKLPPSWRRNIAATKIGAANPMFGRVGAKHPNGKAVIDTKTGERFPTVTAAAVAIGIRMQTLHNMLTGFRPNRTTLRFD